MKKLVKYTVYFEYEDDYWDKNKSPNGDSEGDLTYFIEEHNCHGNFINDLYRSMEKAGDDICNSGVTEIVTVPPEGIEPYKITK